MTPHSGNLRSLVLGRHLCGHQLGIRLVGAPSPVQNGVAQKRNGYGEQGREEPGSEAEVEEGHLCGGGALHGTGGG